MILTAVLAWPAALNGAETAPATAEQAAPRVASSPLAAGTAAGAEPLIPAAPGDANVKLTRIATGLTKPVFVTTAGDGSGRLFIVEQTGRIRIYRNGHLLATPFLSLAGKVSTGSEQGLLGLAFHPSFTTNRKLYVNFTDLAGDTVIREYRASASNPNRVDTSTARRILKIDQPYANHNGGMLAFGPGGRLFIATGDGGGGGDPENRAQNKSTLLGKMLRIDINGTEGSRNYRIPASNPYAGPTPGYGEIWQLGLRNPWRFSFDTATGDMWIGDVGQGAWEEIDHAVKTAAGPGRGLNWGWDVLEGTHCYPPATPTCSTSGKTMPLAEYDHGGPRCAVTGGYVYRGSRIPVLRGGYVFGDYCSGEIWVIPANASGSANEVLLLDTDLLISSFGLSTSGELLVADLRGSLYRIDQG